MRLVSEASSLLLCTLSCISVCIPVRGCSSLICGEQKEAKESETLRDRMSITQEMHMLGLNMRCMGLLRLILRSVS
jgi:hypothetical protein